MALARATRARPRQRSKQRRMNSVRQEQAAVLEVEQDARPRHDLPGHLNRRDARGALLPGPILDA